MGKKEKERKGREKGGEKSREGWQKKAKENRKR